MKQPGELSQQKRDEPFGAPSDGVEMWDVLERCLNEIKDAPTNQIIVF